VDDRPALPSTYETSTPNRWPVEPLIDPDSESWYPERDASRYRETPPHNDSNRWPRRRDYSPNQLPALPDDV